MKKFLKEILLNTMETKSERNDHSVILAFLRAS